MKKLNILFITVCCVAAIVSCRKTETPVKPATEPEQKEQKEEKEETKTVLYGSLGETTKTYLHTDDGEANFKVLWEKYDEIAISKDNNNKFAVYRTTENSGSDKVRFEKKSGTDLQENYVFDAFYPASLVDDNGALQWPAEQRYQVFDNSPAGEAGNNPMWAHATVEKPVTEMKFYNLGGVIRFKISKPAEALSVVRATLSADQPLSGAFGLEDVTITENGQQKTIKQAKITDNSGSIIITPDSAVSIAAETGEASFCFAVPAGTYSGVKFTFICSDGKRFTAQLNPGKTLLVNRSEVTRLTAQGITPSMEGSNCFIGEGNVPIVITAMGNAFNGSTALDGNDAKAVWKAIKGNAQGCKIVWETKNEATAPAQNTIIKSIDFDATNGVLTVVPTGTPGNALVAITSGTGGTGNIVWSYHIWVPETKINDITLNGVTFLDRNLGALEDGGSTTIDKTKAIGLEYQWGRKDPLLGLIVLGDASSEYVTRMNGIKTQNNTDYVSNTTSIAGSILDPSKWIGSSSSSSTSWESSEKLKLWGVDENSNFGTNYTTGFTQYKKTIYDPCPKGYRVASTVDFANGLGNTKASLTDNLFLFKVNDYSFYSPYINCSYPSGSSYVKNEQWNPPHGLWTAVSRQTLSSTAWFVGFVNNGAYITGKGSNGQYRCYCFEVRCVKDTYEYTTN